MNEQETLYGDDLFAGVFDGYRYHHISHYANPSRVFDLRVHEGTDLAKILLGARKTAVKEKRDVTVWRRDVSQISGDQIVIFDKDGKKTVKNIEKLLPSEVKTVVEFQPKEAS